MDAPKFTKEEQLAIIKAVKEAYGFGSNYASQRLGWAVCVFFLAIVHPIFLVIGIFAVIVASLAVRQKLLTEYAKRGVVPVDSDIKNFRAGSSLEWKNDWHNSSYRPHSPSSRFFHSNNK